MVAFVITSSCTIYTYRFVSPRRFTSHPFRPIIGPFSWRCDQELSKNRAHIRRHFHSHLQSLHIICRCIICIIHLHSIVHVRTYIEKNTYMMYNYYMCMCMCNKVIYYVYKCIRKCMVQYILQLFTFIKHHITFYMNHNIHTFAP